MPFYRAALDLARFRAEGLAGLPILTKQHIRANGDNLKADVADRRRAYRTSTGGSTGRPLTVWQDSHYKDWVRAAEYFIYRRFMNLDPVGDPRVVLWGSASDIKKSRRSINKRLCFWLSRGLFLNGFRMSPGDMEDYVGQINRHRPAVLKGYAGAVYKLARFARDRSLRIHHPKAVYTSAETVSEEMRQCIEEVFGCRLFDVYGSREIGLAAAQCRFGKYHLLEFANHVEVVGPDGSPTPTGVEGRMLITTLHNYSMPLIRYEIEDLAVPGSGCDCGNALPVLDRICGRYVDCFMTSDGTVVYGGYLTVLMFFREWVEEYQFLQRDFDDIVIYFVARGEPDAREMDEITVNTRKIMGQTCKVTWERVPEIPRTPHGKLLYTRSLVDTHK